MSDSVWPHRRQPTRLSCPWDSPSKNTGVGCHFLLQCMKVKSESEVAQSCPAVSDPMDCSPPGSSIHGISQARVLEWGAIAFSKETVDIRKNFWHLYAKKLSMLLCGKWIYEYFWESVLMRWVKLDPVIQSEVRQKEKHKCCILTHIYGM